MNRTTNRTTFCKDENAFNNNYLNAILGLF